jgi:hypothetical protein
LNTERQRFTDEFRELSRSQNYYRRELDVFKCLFETAERKLNSCNMLNGNEEGRQSKFELSIEYKYESNSNMNQIKAIVLRNFSDEVSEEL